MSFTEISSDPRIGRALNAACCFLRAHHGASVDSSGVSSIPSARHAVFVLPVVKNGVIEDESVTCPLDEALSYGHNRLILRVWKGTARWWNLGCGNDDRQGAAADVVARAEVAGYRLAHKALSRDDAATAVVVPSVLHFSPGEETDCLLENVDGTSLPWALLTYVGSGSAAFGTGRRHDGGSFVRSMVKIRREYGYDEPHMRHGRVDEGRAADYARKVVRDVVLPIHSYYLGEVKRREDGNVALLGHTKTYAKMVKLYTEVLSGLRQQVTTQNEAFHDAKRTYILAILQIMGTGIDQLKIHAESLSPLGPVLCHGDMQPQNLMFWTSDTGDKARRGSKTIPNVACVLDWEEAGWADPRFELVLICRKICSDRNQADIIWKAYGDVLLELHNTDIGSIDPWLKMEGVHSVLTEISKVVKVTYKRNVALEGKIERELYRLGNLGWTFCLK
uniref:Aminoglycoside phosphotransferase domain-containing protein n=1 Tax=Corethron hystrix TaxID=216773 RepID=A0A7S1BSL3_9STRA|mmetsp:Transcript_39536/g.92376  ORF Transcript_39536/g.92376 Transcript_39536/m.92376 type:complete len:448 (+) Transcript_39536:180-1523(+)